MNAQSDRPPSRPSLRLLGGAALFAGDGTAVTGPVAQRHRLALLAILARAAPAGVQRERLTGLLWPERDKESARNLLRVALHTVRQEVGHDAIPTVGTEVRLDLDAIRVDVAEFTNALARGDAASAVQRYGGPFLDGMHLDQGADAFEDWSTTERTRLARDYERALEQLAEAAERAGDLPRAAAHWQALAAARPTDARIARRCVEALVATGDTAAAVAHARQHTARVEAELGLPADAAIEERLATLESLPRAEPLLSVAPATRTPLLETDTSDQRKWFGTGDVDRRADRHCASPPR
jgi:DNA-binding SARP family transcriptional activator